jgi:organic radical activating enzyme
MRIFRVNNIFYSLQGEGRNTGRAAVFIRFAGCNLRCSFCDTEFESYREMTEEDILAVIRDYPSHFVVLTGGEPTLQVDESFVDFLHQHDYEVAMESNGTRPAPKNLDWLTVSPKTFSGEWGEVRGKRLPDELKVVFDENTDPETFLSPLTSHLSPLLYLQPCDTGDPVRNKAIIQACVEYIKAHPQWRLSLQTHKLIDIE